MAFGKKSSNEEKPAAQPAPTDEEKKASDLAEPTVAENGQTVDPEQDKVLPESKPDDLAPVPDAATGKPTKTASSSTGYRVADGKSIVSKGGDLIDGGHEIGEQHLEGGAERLEEFVKSGHVVKTDKSSDAPSTSGEQKPVDDNSGSKLFP